MNNLNEEAIKNNLVNIGLQENRFGSSQFLQTFQKSNYLPSKSYSFREISDWENRQYIEEGNKELKIQQANHKSQEEEAESLKFSYLISKRRRNNQVDPQLASQKKKVELSPINVKFHHQRAKSLFQKSGPSSPRRIVEDNPTSFYQSNYERLSLLYEMKTRQNKGSKQSKTQQLPLILPQFNEAKLPKTERVSSIMRLMKKHQQIRVYKHHHAQKFEIIKLP